MRKWLVFMMGTLMGLGCSASESEEPAPDLARTAQNLAKSQCARLFECCSPSEIGVVFVGLDIDDEATCVPSLQNYLTTFVVPGWQAAIDARTLSVNIADEQDCLEALEQRACGEFAPSPVVNIFEIEACRSFLSPNLESSGFCAEDFECKTGFCSRAAGSTQGTCKVPVEASSPCLNEVCGPPGYALFCDEGTCVPRGAFGETCSRNEECDSGNCIASDVTKTCGEAPVACQGAQ